MVPRTLLTAALACLIATPISAQTRGGRPGGFRALQNPVALLMEHRTDLDLSQEQFERLEQISANLGELNAPHLEGLRELRGGGGTPDRQQMRPLMEAIRGNSDAAREEAMEVLEPEQQEAAERILEEARPQRRPGGRRPVDP